MIALDALFISWVLLAVQGVVLGEVVVLRERPVLAPIMLFGTFAMLIVGVTLVAVGAFEQALPWFAPMIVFVIAYSIHRLYEGWGM